MNYASSYYSSHKEQMRRNMQRFRERHPGYAREWYQAHKEQCKAASRLCYRKHHDARSAQIKAYYADQRHLTPACGVLREIRKSEGMSQTEWGIRFGVRQETVSRYERDAIPIPASIREEFKEEIANANG